MHTDDYQALYAIWSTTPGLTMRKADSHAGFKLFLERNPGLSLVAESDHKLIGGILGGQDGRFGSIHHLVVLSEFRKQGIGTRLVKQCLEQIKKSGVEKCHIFVNRDNPEGLKFWESIGWQERLDLTMASYIF
jgi:putative acetyltransferase